MNDRHDEYRRQAKAAEDQAEKAANDGDRASWLRIAQGWLSLLPHRRTSPTERFDAAEKEQGTGQDKSRGSH